MANIGDRALLQNVLDSTSIRAGNASTMRINLADYERVCFHVQLGDCAGIAGTYSNWNGADILTTCKLEQHKAATGGTPKDITGKNVNQTTAGTAGDTYQLECRSEDLDTENGYTYVGVYLASTSNTGVDNVNVFAVADGARYANDNESGVDGTI